MDESNLWVKKNKEKKLEKSPLRKIVFGKEHRRAFFLCALVMTGMVYMYHGSIGILPTYMHEFGNFERADIALVMIVATTASWGGMVFTGWLSQQIGRKKAMIGFALCSVIVVIPSAFFILGGGLIGILFVTIYAFVVATASGPIPAFFSERFPTEVRNSAAGFSYNAGLIFGSWSPLIALHFMSQVEIDIVPIILGINIIIGAIILIVPTLLSPETKDYNLD